MNVKSLGRSCVNHCGDSKTLHTQISVKAWQLADFCSGHTMTSHGLHMKLKCYQPQSCKMHAGILTWEGATEEERPPEAYLL